MSTSKPDNHRTGIVLHIRPETHPSSLPSVQLAEQMLADCHAAVETCADVYVGLAEILVGQRAAPQGQRRFDALVVCTAGMSQTDMEFFTIMARQPDRIPTWVYGDKGSAAQITDAINHGADGVLTEQTVNSWAPPATEPVHPEPANAPPEPDDVPLPNTTPVAPPEPSKEETGDAPTDQPGVRVPWLSYENRPVRNAPRRDPPATPQQPARLTEPLLTPEELNALMGDDISAIAPDNVQPDQSALNDEHRGTE